MPNLFHRHEWIEQQRVYIPPQTRGFEMTGHTPESLVNRCVFGLTTIVDRCVLCGERKTTEVLGDARQARGER